MTVPVVVAVAPGSPAEQAGIRPGDAVLRLNGRVPRDIIEWRLWSDEADVDLLLSRHGLEQEVAVAKTAGRPIGAEVASAVFDRVRTCDNHCEFCFIYQLPKGMRSSLYLKDDDYRLSFLYGNFTTLTRFTEADLERVVTEGLSPLNVSIHATDPDLRVRMLRNKRGATSLRWLRGALGVDVTLLYTLVFGLGAALAGLAGVMAGPTVSVESGMGEPILILTFVVIVIGGIGSIRGAFVAAILVGMVDTVGSFRTQLPPVYLLWLIGVLSANLAVVNVLPLPPLDGGRVMMALVGRFAGKRLTPELERGVYLAGWVGLMTFLAWITLFDVRRLVGG